MNISKKAATVLCSVGYFGSLGTFGIPIYSTFKICSLRDSADHVMVKELEKKSSDLGAKLVECAPAANSLPTQQCIDLKVQYNTLQKEHKAIMESEDYKAVEMQIQNLPGLGYAFSTLAVSVTIFSIGFLALRRRYSEEYIQNQSKGKQ